MLPFLGSVPHLESKYPKFQTHLEAFAIDNYQRFVKEQGMSIFKFGIPGIGQGVRGEIHVVFDPRECLKIVQAEGKHPSSVVEVKMSRTMAETARGMKNMPSYTPIQPSSSH